MTATFHFDRMSIAPDGVEVKLDWLPRKGDWISFDGDIGKKIDAWSDEADDVLVVAYVQHNLSTKKENSIRVECAMSRVADAF